MQSNYFSSLLPELSTRAARATISKLGFSNPPLRRHLLDVFARGYGEPGCFLGDPVFEATFGWKQADTTMAVLAKTLLHPDLVDAMDKPWGDNAKEYQFPRTGRPYTHQLVAWHALLGPGHRSVVVTSGTGSGKTECFMVPVLSSLALARSKGADAQGVRALFLYPLNALIQSQRERLRAWTGPFNGDVRFCLYNGMTPEEQKAEKYREAPNEVHDRATLRANPPAILVTNPTMLEYMLVRAQDAPILDKSQGKLEWIILDEAHNYVGSQAAELALLLRRVLHAFGTSAERVRFVATSATIGSGDSSAKIQLQEFLAKVAGISSDRVVVIEGERQVPEMTAPINAGAANSTVDEMVCIQDPAERYQRLSVHPMARKLRDLFVPEVSKRSFQPLSAIKSAMGLPGAPAPDAKALEWLDLLTSAVHGAGRSATPYLPLRLHAFHNTLNGLWACASPDCSARIGTQLLHEDWPFGVVYMDERRRCNCGAPVFPLTSCNDCNETFLSADVLTRAGGRKLLPPMPKDVDEFMLDRDPEEHESGDEGTPEEVVQSGGMRSYALIVNGKSRGVSVMLDLENSELIEKPAEGGLTLRIQDVSMVDKREVLKCPCCDGDNALNEQFRKPMLGAPFLLGNIIPTLLEFCPDGESPLDAPMRGRRMITFTDSRQGTARIAAQLQQDAERNALRAAVYRKLVTATAGSGGARDEIEQKIAAYKTALAAFVGKPEARMFEQFINEAKEALRKLSAGRVTTYTDIIEWLSTQAPDISRWIHAFYAESDGQFKAALGKELVTKILICREFARRPKRQNSLETMGLVSVQYPKLDNVKTLRPAVVQAGLSLQEWCDFLKTCMDFLVRQYFCLNVPSAWERWGGNRVFAKQMLPPTSLERSTSRLARWPKVMPHERQNRLVRLLAYVLKVDPHTEMGRDHIDSLLLAAWDDLTLTSNLLQLGGGQGRYLEMTDMAFQNITRAWVCPVTRRVLDCTLRGVTPYLPSKQLHDGVAICRPIEIPVCDIIALDYSNDDARVDAARAWVDAQEALTSARIEGIWSSINDRVVEGAGYFRAVEHSAQQAGSRLQQYESQFKRGAINLMSCSTTMEMGVDIGGINMVAMNNVPPHPANYLQRAGRAGRRAETRSVAFTVCKNNPHDQHVFRHTTWPFETRLPTPSISLDSPLLVQRHINAMLLAQFLRLQDKQGKLDKLTLEWWMLPRGSSRQERFAAWCDCFDPSKHVTLQGGLESLIKRTVFEGRSATTALVAEVGLSAARHAKQWLQELNAIDEQITDLSKKDEGDRIPLRALQIQRTRLTGEYLLRELATSGFLPGYGFPTDITTFETLNKDSLEIQRSRDVSSSSREDNKFQRRELPSRDTVTALREYAPGANVVIDGLVYESAGITLNWHAPATLDQVNELQNIRQAWRCGHCGASGTSVLASHLEHCLACGSRLRPDGQRFMQYLEPAGFSVDLYAATHNDIALQKYVPVEAPWITANGDWMTLANPGLGSFRASPQASVFHHSSGIGGSGYAVCLECGRAAPMGYKEDADDMPAAFRKPHKRLRGRRGQGDDWNCGGSENPFKIKKGVHFGREYTTDVLELNLVSIDGHPLVDEAVAYTIAVALRRAMAARLGIDESELGCDSKMIRDAQGRRTRALQIFDMRSAGYSSLVAPNLPILLKEAQMVLLCERQCDSACQSCLLTFDTRFRVESLDRRAALAFLTDEWMSALALPEDERLFGELSQSEYQPANEAISRELNRSGALRLYVYLNGDSAEWDISVSPLRSLLHRLSVKSDVELCIVTPQADLKNLSVENASILSSLETACAVSIRHGKPPALNLPGACIATVETRDGGCYTWASQEPDAVLPGPHWGEHGSRPLIASPTAKPSLTGEFIQRPLPATTGLKKFDIAKELDGPGSGFGARFWSFVGEGLPMDKVVTSVIYDDRYLATPVSCALLVEVISALKAIYEPLDAWSDPVIRVTTMLIDEERYVRYRDQWMSDWEKSAVRDAALTAAFEFCGISANVTSKHRRDTIHGRRLTVLFSDRTSVAVWLDQGFSYWNLARQQFRTAASVFAANHDADGLGARLAEIKISVEGHDLPTQVFFEVE